MNADELSQDRYYIYGKPVLEAMQFILSLQAIPSGPPSEEKYKMVMMFDGMACLGQSQRHSSAVPPGLNKVRSPSEFSL